MKGLTKIVSLFAILFITSCQVRKNADPEIKEMNPRDEGFAQQSKLKRIYNLNSKTILGNTEEVFLSEVTDSIIYIKLQTTDNYLIGEDGVKVRLTGSFIFISEHGKPIGMFDKNGKFIRSIGKIGRGPEEFFFDYNFWPDEENKIIYVWGSRNKIMKYNCDGDYLGRLDLNFSFSNFVYLGNSLFFSYTPTQLKNDTTFYRHFVFNKEGNLVSALPEQEIRSAKSSQRVIISSPQLYQTIDGWLLQTWDRDTIYKISADSDFHSYIIWDFGKNSRTQSISNAGTNIIDLNAVESGEYIFFGYSLNKQYSIGLFNKASGEYKPVGNPHYSFPDKVYRGMRYAGLTNDLDGGPSFWPRFSGYKGRCYTKLLYASDLINYDFNVSTEPVKLPEQQEKFLNMVSSLDENDNPVLMIAYIK